MPPDAFIPPIFDTLATDWYGGKGATRPTRQRALPGLVTPHSAQPEVPKKTRSRLAPAFQLTDRDANVLRTLLRLRVMDRPQIEKLFFPNFSMACERLRRLYLYGYIERIYRPPRPNGAVRGPAFRLATRGAKLLADEQGMALADLYYWGKTDDRRGHKTERTYIYLDHALALSSIRIAIEQGTSAAGCAIRLWQDDVDLHRALATTGQQAATQGKQTPATALVPDGYFVLLTQTGSVGHFFIEADRGTESITKKWKAKTLAYKTLFASGAFHRQYQVRQATTAFRVLVTTQSSERAEHIKAAAERYGSKELSQLFLVAPISDMMTTNPLTTPIWRRGGTTGVQGLL